MIISTSRFGKVKMDESDIFLFKEGILGFADLHRFVILDDPNDEIFAWMQSCDEPTIAFPILEPELVTENYEINLAKSDAEALSLPMNSQAAAKFAIITIPEDPTQMTANLKAPIVINLQSRLARQCVLQDNQLAIREPIFTRLQQRVVANPQQTIKTMAGQALAVAVRLDEREITEAEI